MLTYRHPLHSSTSSNTTLRIFYFILLIFHTVSLIATSQPFKGFILQARESSSGQLIGSFTIEDEAKSHRLSCSGNQLVSFTALL